MLCGNPLQGRLQNTHGQNQGQTDASLPRPALQSARPLGRCSQHPPSLSSREPKPSRGTPVQHGILVVRRPPARRRRSPLLPIPPRPTARLSSERLLRAGREGRPPGQLTQPADASPQSSPPQRREDRSTERASDLLSHIASAGWDRAHGPAAHLCFNLHHAPSSQLRLFRRMNH